MSLTPVTIPFNALRTTLHDSGVSMRKGSHETGLLITPPPLYSAHRSAYSFRFQYQTKKMLASAPGKVLILGGYLIVEAPNIGISVGVNARFTTAVTSTAPSTNSATTTVHVASPQFNQQYSFVCTAVEDEVHIDQIVGPPSPFLLCAVLYAVTAARTCGGAVDYELHLQLLADNDFYSQRNHLEAEGKAVNVSSLRNLPNHLPLVGAVSKTGLGSSAAMTTSVVACLATCFHMGGGDRTELIHRVAQVAHSVAQGKIGSGFDVFTAVYGTCAYRRFPAKNIEMIMEGSDHPSRAKVSQLAACINLSLDWVKHEPFHLPEGLQLVLGDVHCGGSSTPGMVAKVMAWRKSVSAQPDNLWEKLRRSNENYIMTLRAIAEQAWGDPIAHRKAIEVLQSVKISAHRADSEAETAFLVSARMAAESRRYLREMGEAAGVGVEPPQLTNLLDATAGLPGVFAVGCPGAGGYDAVFALVIGGHEQCVAVETFWEGLNVCPLLVREDPRGLLTE